MLKIFLFCFFNPTIFYWF